MALTTEQIILGSAGIFAAGLTIETATTPGAEFDQRYIVRMVAGAATFGVLTVLAAIEPRITAGLAVIAAASLAGTQLSTLLDAITSWLSVTSGKAKSLGSTQASGGTK
jgi:hypothetical protein